MYIIDFGEIHNIRMVADKYNYPSREFLDSIWDLIDYFDNLVDYNRNNHYNIPPRDITRLICIRLLANENNTINELISSQSIDNQVIALYMLFSVDEIELVRELVKTNTNFFIKCE